MESKLLPFRPMLSLTTVFCCCLSLLFRLVICNVYAFLQCLTNCCFCWPFFVSSTFSKIFTASSSSFWRILYKAVSMTLSKVDRRDKISKRQVHVEASPLFVGVAEDGTTKCWTNGCYHCSLSIQSHSRANFHCVLPSSGYPLTSFWLFSSYSAVPLCYFCASLSNSARSIWTVLQE